MPRPVLLAVDGDPAAKAALERELRKRYEADSQVLCAGSGAAGLQGLEQIGARGGEVARVLADLRLPDMSGMELMARVHGLDPAAKRGFHGPGRSSRRHLGFVVVHVQPFVLALVVPGFGWTVAAAIHGLVVAGAVVVLAGPRGCGDRWPWR